MPAVRLASVDALRGIAVAAMLVVNDAGDWDHVWPWIDHAPWHGCTLADLIFPLFLFVVGVSVALAAPPAGANLAAWNRSVAVRTLRLFVLGLALHGIATLLIPDRAFRLPGVLQRIALCYAGAGIVAVRLRPAAQWVTIGVLLLGSWALLVLGGDLTPEGNVEARLDTFLLGELAYHYDPASGRAFDPEGLLTTLPALATTLLGLRAGAWLAQRDLRRLLGAGAAFAVAGLTWARYGGLPLNKALWTASYVLWTGGVSCLALALLHVLVDRRGWPALGRRFGVNAILAYAGAWITVCVLAWGGWDRALYAAAFAPLSRAASPEAASLAYALCITAAWWLVVLVLDRRRWYLRI